MGQEESQVFGRYALYGEIAAGGMATVHYGRLLGQVGFSRPVAIKRLLPELALDPDFVKMFLEESRLAARVRHPNVVAALDVVSLNEEILLVMDYVHGETLSRLVRVSKRMGEHVPPRIAVGIICGALEGLHAAHEAKSEKGQPLGLVHRDVSPQNIMVGKDGVTRVLDFGVAKATAKRTETRGDLIKGKAAYMAPEQLAGGLVDQRADIFGASVCLWQALTGERLFTGDSFEAIAQAVVTEPIRPASTLAPNITRSLDEVLMKGLDREAEHRWPTAREMAIQLERALAPASLREIGAWVERIAGDKIEARARVVQQIERVSIASISVGEPESEREAQKIPDLVADAARKNTQQPGFLDGLAIPGLTQPPDPQLFAGLSAQGAPAAPQPAPHIQPAQAYPSRPTGPERTPLALVSQPAKTRSHFLLPIVAVVLTIIIGAGMVMGMRELQRRAALRALAENGGNLGQPTSSTTTTTTSTSTSTSTATPTPTSTSTSTSTTTTTTSTATSTTATPSASASAPRVGRPRR